MQNIKIALLAATAIAGSVATPVLAQAVIPGVGKYAIPAPGLPTSTLVVNGSTFTYDGDMALHGAGSTAVQNVINRVFNCLGTPYKLGNGQPGQSGAAATAGSLAAKAPGVYAGTPSMTCNNESANVSFTGGTSNYEVQPQVTDTNGNNWGFAAKYVGTGSGFGRKMWYWANDVFDGGSGSNKVTGVYNPFNLVSGDNRWSHEQYAFSDAPLAASELATYNTTGNGVTLGGPAIQFPLFVVPITIAYDSDYGVNKAGHTMALNVQWTGNFNGTTIASMRLNAQAYCSIFNGDITNWNDPQLTALNKKVPLYDPVNDTLTRWNTDGVPMRLVGRMDNSGSTDIFTRHLAAVCGSTAGLYTPVNHTDGSTANKYLNNAEGLPYNSTQNGGVDYTVIRSDVNLKPGNNGNHAKIAGTTNTVSGQWFNGTAIVSLGGSTVNATPASGYNGTGLYIVANGGGNVAKAIILPADYAGGDGTTLNGKIGYISADFVQPSVDASSGLVAAQLSMAAAGPFVVPTIANGLKAFGTIQPPESTSTGAYAPGTDSRTVSSGTTTRGNPLAWTDILYQSGTTLAAPAAGYPITGTTQFFGYTCYATTGNQMAVAEMLGALIGKVQYDAYNTTTPTKIAAGAFNATTPATPGIVDASNLGIVPMAWRTAIYNTFLTSAGDAKTAGLWFTSGLVPTFVRAVAARPVSKTYPMGTPAVPAATVQPTGNTTACSGVTGV
jgi:ABC-type phosphate transport system substrate-binding protein